MISPSPLRREGVFIATIALALLGSVALVRADSIPANVVSLDPTELEHLETDFLQLQSGAGSTASASMLTGTIATGKEEQYTATLDGASGGTCGDGKREGAEECDDGNTTPNDGCNAACKVEGGYQCLPEKIGGLDKCSVCGDTQCTTFFGRQSRCLDTVATKDAGLEKQEGQEGAETAGDAGADAPAMLSLLQETAGAEGAYARANNGFCECASQQCTMVEGPGPMDFTCQSTDKGWARTSLTNSNCTCGTGFCSMPLAGEHAGQSQCVPLHANMIRNNDTGLCQCRAEQEAVNSTDPTLAQPAQAAACKILPVEPVVKVQGGADKFGEFECVGSPYVKSASDDTCADCESTDACKVDRTVGSGNFLCFKVTNGTSAKTSPYVRASDGKCECGADQCLKPRGDHFVCRDLTGAAPYGPTKQGDGKCGCSASADVCRVDITDGFRCVHMAKDNFAQDYRKAHDGKCDCKFGFCQAPNDPDTGRLVCKSAQPDSAYQRQAGSLTCECKPGSCKFPGGVCKKCPTIPGQCESHCHNTTSTEITCTKFCRTSGITLHKARATAQGQLQSSTEIIAREVGCFVEKETVCTVSASTKQCTQTKGAKALYDCPAMKAGNVPLRLSDGTETHGYRSMCNHDDLECQIQNCGRTPDSQKCMSQAMLV